MAVGEHLTKNDKGLMDEESWFDFLQKQMIFLFTTVSRPALGQPNLIYNG
jgi:hypothetical protein